MNRQVIIQKLFFYTLILIVITLPFFVILNSASIILLFALWLAEGNFYEKIIRFKNNPLILVFTSLYFLHLFGMFYTENIAEGKFILEKKLSILILPLILGTSNAITTITKKQFKKILLAFVVACFAASVICLSNGLYHYFFYHEIKFLFHHKLGLILNFHAIYFAIYIVFSMFILLWFLLNNWNDYKLFLKIIFISLLIYFFLFFLLLSARMVLLSFLLIIFVAVIFYSWKKRKLKIGLFSLFIVLSTSLFFLQKFDFIKKRYTDLLNSKLNERPNGANDNGLTVRLMKWKCSLKGIKENFILGVGTGDGQDYLQVCYVEKDFWGQLLRYNSHNQYMQTGLSVGILGILCFLSCIIIPAVISFRQKNYLYFIFICLFSFCCLTESMLETHKGTVFYTLFNSLFAFYSLHYPLNKGLSSKENSSNS